MTEDDIDTLVDDATHAVNNLIPNAILDALNGGGRSELLVRINDALTPILRDLAESAAPAGENEKCPATRVSTIAAFIAELIDMHVEKCESAGDAAEDRPAHIVSETFGSRAYIASTCCVANETEARVYLVLEDGNAFRLTIEGVEGL